MLGRTIRRFASPWGALLLLAPFLLLSGPRPASAAPPITPEMQKRIDAAIEKGAKWLRGHRLVDGSFSPLAIHGEPAHVLGVTALCGLALLAAGDTLKDPGMKTTLEFLRTRDERESAGGTRSTYGTGVLLMFLTEAYRPKDDEKRGGGRTSDSKKKGPCGLPPDVSKWVQDLASWLCSVQLDEGWWRYPHTPPGDLSNTQYALLGLRAARDCGAAVPSYVFYKSLVKTLEAQEKDGPKMKRLIAGTKPGEPSYVIEGGDRARGWPYQDTGGLQITGSMTTAAIAVLAIARDALTKPEAAPQWNDELERKVGRSAQDGFTWLDKNFAVDKNPPAGSAAWHFYYLYGLERACIFGGRDMIGIHDWYLLGAQHLLGRQGADGGWRTGFLGGDEIGASDACDTAWAILFLKKSTRPLQPIPSPTITPGGG